MLFLSLLLMIADILSMWMIVDILIIKLNSTRDVGIPSGSFLSASYRKSLSMVFRLIPDR